MRTIAHLDKVQSQGSILADKTTLIVVQNLLSEPRSFTGPHILALENFIRAAVLHEKVYVFIGGSGLIDTVDVRLPDMLMELVSKELVSPLVEPHDSEKKEKELLTSLISEIKNKGYLENIPKHVLKTAELLRDLRGYYYRRDKYHKLKALLKSQGIEPTPLNVDIVGNIRRTLVYLEASNKEKVPYLPFFERNDYIKSFPILESRTSAASEIVKHFEIAEREQLHEMMAFFGVKDYRIDLPMFTGYVLSRCSKPIDIIDETIQLRKESKLKKFRERCASLTKALYENNIDTINKNYKRINEILFKEYGESSCQELIRSFPELVLNPQQRIASFVLESVKKGIDFLRARDLIFLSKDIAKSMCKHGDVELERVFGKGLTFEDREFLDTVTA